MVAQQILADTANWEHMNNWGGNWMWMWGLVTLFVIAAFAVSAARGGQVAAAPMSPTPPAPGPVPGVRANPTGRAIEILAERYAAGDLSTEEYRERLAELG